MGSRLTDIVVDCHDPVAQAAFWAAALDYHVVRAAEGQVEIAAWEREPPDLAGQVLGAPMVPALVFVSVPEGKTVKNRVHLEVRPNRLHRLFLELVPGGTPVKKSTSQYKTLLATVRPKDLAGKTRPRMAAEELADLERLDAKLKAMKSELKAAVQARGLHLMDIHGIGPAGAARIIQARTLCTSPVHRTDRRVPRGWPGHVDRRAERGVGAAGAPGT